MSITTRQKHIPEYLAGHETFTVDDAVRIFQVSPATIRRDFAEIVMQGGKKWADKFKCG